MAAEIRTLTDVIDDIKKDTAHEEKISVGEMVAALDRRGFGPLLMGPALLVVLPTGAIPGVPAICAVLIFLVAIQIAIGKQHPWMPEFIKRFSLKRSNYLKAVKKARPVAKKIDRVVHPRLEFLTHKTVQRFIALLCVVLSLVMGAIGFIPMLPAIAGLPVLLFALGISARDGGFVIAGFMLSFAAAVLIAAMSGIWTPEGEYAQYIPFVP